MKTFDYYRERILPHCYRTPDGVLVRAELRKTPCRICLQPRWDDGLPCPNNVHGQACGSYQNKNIDPKAPPRRFRERLDITENGRLA